MTFAVQNSIAYDTNGVRDPLRDDWILDETEDIPESELENFKRSHYPKAVQVIRLTPEQVNALRNL